MSKDGPQESRSPEEDAAAAHDNSELKAEEFENRPEPESATTTEIESPAASSCESAKAAEPETLRWWQRFSSGRYVPILLVVLATLIVCVYFFDNPPSAHLSEAVAIADGQAGSIEHVIDTGLHLGAGQAASLLCLWLLLSPWWASQRKSSAAGESAGQLQTKPSPFFPRRSIDGLSLRWFVLLVIAAIVVGAVLRYPRLHHSFWNDEEVAYRKFIHGDFRLADDGELKWKPISWQRTWFYNVTGNNHILQSVGSRLTLEISDADPTDIDRAHVLTRILPMAAGLLTIGALALLVWQSGAGLAAALAAWLLALHPWHVRYSVEARGYSGMLLFAVLTMLFLVAALQRKTWICWLGYGICQLACLLCFPAAVYLVAALNLGVLIHLIRRKDQRSLKCWSTVCVVGAAIFCQLMAPSFLRMLQWLSSPYELPRPINFTWFLDLWSHVAAGIPHSDGHAAKAFQLDYLAWHRGASVRFWLLILVFPLISAAGMFAASLRFPILRWPVIGVLVGLLFTLSHLITSPMVFHSWYLLPLLLPFCIGMSVPATLIARRNTSAGWISAAVLLGLFAIVAAAPVKRLREYPRHPMHDAVKIVRGEAPILAPEHAQHVTLTVGPGARQFASYDPRAIAIGDAQELREAIQLADQEGKKLTVYCIDESALPTDLPQVAAMLYNESEFRETGFLHGVEAFWSITIFEREKPKGDL